MEGMEYAVEPAVAPPPGNPRFSHVDGLRAVAALSVVAFHAAIYTDYIHGWAGAFTLQLAAGVSIFFLLSGFLLYRPFVAARLSGGRPVRVQAYARRRLLRIVPAYWLALTVLAFWPGLPGRVLSHWWVYFGFVQDFRQVTLFGGLGTAWSLGTEISFYALLPLYALVLASLRLPSRRAVVVVELGLLTLLSVGSAVFRTTVSGSHPNLEYVLPATFDWFALGMALAVVSAAFPHANAQPRLVGLVERHATACWSVSAAFLALGAVYWHRTREYDPYSGGPLHLIWGLFALFLVLPAAFPGAGGGVPRRVLSLRVFAWLGLVSYGIYLWHLPLVAEVGKAEQSVGVSARGLAATIVTYALLTCVTVACAALSYYGLERRVLRLKESRARKKAPFSAAVRDVERPGAGTGRG